MSKSINWLLLATSLLSCHHKEKKPEESYFPVLSFLKSQVTHMDTSIYPLQKIVIIDSIHADTTDIKREDFRGLAKDFLDIPDIASRDFKKRYKEEKLYDETLNRVIISYQPVDPDKEEIQREEVLVTPDPVQDKVNAVIIDRVMNTKDSSVQKKLLWKVNQSFQVTTITQKPGMEEKVSSYKVTWNENNQ